MEYRVPDHLHGPFASRLDGLWSSHRTHQAAWVHVWPWRLDPKTLVLALNAEGWERSPVPKRRPGQTSGASGKNVADRVRVKITERDGWRDAAERAGVSVAKWVGDAADLRLKSAR
jgi:hypothetical protein